MTHLSVLERAGWPEAVFITIENSIKNVKDKNSMPSLVAEDRIFRANKNINNISSSIKNSAGWSDCSRLLGKSGVVFN